MRALIERLLPAAVAGMALLLIGVSPVLGHSGEGISIEHVLIEIGTWAAGIVAVIAAIVGVFWVRARRHVGDE